MEAVEELYDTFWSPKFWLPPNVTWEELEKIDDIFLPRPRHMWKPFGIAVVLILCRLLWERIIALPLGRYFKVKETPPRKPVHNEVLEELYRASRDLPSYTKLQELSTKLQWSTRQIERWWRRRRVANKPTEMVRWKETTWRLLFYVVAFWYGVFILYDKPWFWDTKHCWLGYPRQHVTDEVYWYYMIELGFYWSLVMSLFMDVKRKDFMEMIIHHVATITLLMLSYCDNMVRIGTLVLVIHDAVDWILEAGKLFMYAKYQKVCDGLFVVFAIVWFVTRLVIYPVVVLRSTLNEGHHYLGMAHVYYAFNGLLVILQVLHYIWFVIICRMVWSYLHNGKVQKDGRSDTEPETNSEDESIVQSDKGDANKLNKSNNNVASVNSASSSSPQCAMANGSSSGAKTGGSKIPVKSNGSPELKKKAI